MDGNYNGSTHALLDAESYVLNITGRPNCENLKKISKHCNTVIFCATPAANILPLQP